jgi:hypothetical protein
MCVYVPRRGEGEGEGGSMLQPGEGDVKEGDSERFMFDGASKAVRVSKRMTLSLKK